jgi:SAM-dependent methyltransferase
MRTPGRIQSEWAYGTGHMSWFFGRVLVGIDGSAGMLRAARQTHSGPGVEFVHGRIEDLPSDLGPVDLVLSRMAFHYVADLTPVLSTTTEMLGPGGRIVFSVAHPELTCHAPATDVPRTDLTVDNYFVRGPRPRQWFGQQTTWHHRTVEDYVEAVLDAGMAIEALRECEPDATRMNGHPRELERRRRVPVMLLISARAN